MDDTTQHWLESLVDLTKRINEELGFYMPTSSSIALCVPHIHFAEIHDMLLLGSILRVVVPSECVACDLEASGKPHLDCEVCHMRTENPAERSAVWRGYICPHCDFSEFRWTIHYRAWTPGQGELPISKMFLQCCKCKCSFRIHSRPDGHTRALVGASGMQPPDVCEYQ